MRGKPMLPTNSGELSWITPADAGKTARSDSLRRWKRDHPRGCGENRKTMTEDVEDAGSPPRMRGKPLPAACVLSKRRITPADAGKTSGWKFAKTACWDHPRGCGENLPVSDDVSSMMGSPPRMRGKPFVAAFCSVGIGITPADAGKTQRTKQKRLQAKDHPRGCGENIRYCNFAFRNKGSPPRMRGKRCGQNPLRCSPGITPADAGKTLKRSFRNQPFCSRAVQISFNFSNSLNVSLQSGSAR